MILWVAGGRGYTNKLAILGALRPYALPGNLLVHGSAKGADLLAEKVWREEFQLPYLGIPARWKHEGKRAGFERNQLIASGFMGLLPQLLIHFPGGDGTQMAVDIAERLNIPREGVADR